METMKKPYVRPEEEVVELKMEQQLMAGSVGTPDEDAPVMDDPSF